MRRTWVRELGGWVLAAAVSLIAAASVASSARAELLFRDGDSLIVAMLSHSLLAGDPFDWAMSSVLFLPETAVFAGLDVALPLDTNGLFAVSGVVNLLALYGALRLVAGRRREGRAPVAWSVIALAAFGVLAMTETSASRDALELASLQLTTTYYSATVVGVVLAIGIARRMLDGARLVPMSLALGAVALVSTLSNPLFAAWATVPLGTIAIIGALRAATRRRMLTVLAALIGGTALGFAARIPFSAWIANTGAGYAQPDLWRESIGYYGDLLIARLSTPLGVVALVVVIALITLAVVQTVRAEDPGSRFVALAAWVVPLLVAVGAIALGTHAARYLQPLAFAPVLALVAMPRTVRLPARLRRQAAAVAAVILVVAGGLSIPRLSDAANAPDADAACVTDWVEASARTGAGQFWTVRLPKLHLDDPSQLVQVDHQLNGYAWLVNREDFDAGTVSFLVEDAQTVEWDLPIQAIPDEIVDCGRYRILDFGETELPLGPQRS
ncbi:hypothetical protein ACIQTT_10180 [Microbacterium sp. NPDC090225]|uniref:hypothetical protein n=1 Tax=Microbacterium sp. NPDC090225 TaxID=3364207 RepID=UPI00381E63B1